MSAETKTLTVAYVAGAVRKIRDLSHDAEAAHFEEDMLYFEVLRAIAQDKCDNPGECARQAFLTKQIKFRRAC